MNLFLFFYLIILNLITFIIMFADKRRAIRHQWRIPEKTIFLFSFLGGSLGAILSMYLFRHKTKHLSFRILLPIFLIWNAIVAFWIISGEIF